MTTPTVGASSRRDARSGSRKRWYLRKRIWVPAVLLVLLIALGILGAHIAQKALAARDALQSALPMAATVQEQIAARDLDGARATVTDLRTFTAEAQAQADGAVWRAAEALPMAGPNLAALRVVSATVDDLVERAALPATELDLDRFAPVDGRIDPAAFSESAALVEQIADSVADAEMALEPYRDADLIEQVADGVARLDASVRSVGAVIEPARDILEVLPGILGADGARDYLVLVQNNAESRGTGGNPAALVKLRVEDGVLSITQQASSRDFNNGRPQTIADVDPETLALYGDKVGRYMQDVTTTPQFPESARLMDAFWQDSFGTPISGTVSIDPVALSYLIQATGPVSLPNGDVLTSDTVVPTLLNDVYERFPVTEVQDAYFAAAAGAVFGALTNVQEPLALLTQVQRAVDEGRFLYAPKDSREIELVAGTRLEGVLPDDNADRTVVGSYVNDITEGKLDYYLNTAVTATSDQCSSEGAPVFSVSTTLDYVLQPDEVRGLARYISPANFFPKGVLSTDLVVYGPVGSTLVGASVDGQPVDTNPLPHLGRTAVKINVESMPATVHEVSVQFSGSAGDEYGPLAVQHTPMVRETPVTIEQPGCS